MTIFRKLVLAGFMAFAGLVSLSSYSIWVINSYNGIIESTEKLGVISSVSDALGVEIERYLSESNPAYTDAFDAKIRTATETADLLAERFQAQKVALDTSPLVIAINHIFARFHTVENLKLQIGLDENSGLRGELRSAVRSAEAIVLDAGDSELEALILTLRRNEKDFLLRLDEKYVDRFTNNYSVTVDYLQSASGFTSAERQEIFSLLEVYKAAFLQLTMAHKTLGYDSMSGMRGQLTTAQLRLSRESAQFKDEFVLYVDELSRSKQRSTLIISILFVLVVTGIIAVIVVTIQRRQSSINAELHEFVDALNQDSFDYQNRLSTGKADELNEIAKAVNAFLNRLESLMSEQLRILTESNRNRSALDVADTPVMIADTDMNILYLNQSAQKMMDDRGPTLKSALPNLQPDQLVGANVDQFHQNPSHQRHLVEGLSSTHRSQIEVAGLTFGLTATPLFDEAGSRVGTVIEWDDQTEEINRQRQVEFISQENARIRQALDNVTTNTMIADNDRTIVYANKSVLSMLKANEEGLRESLPHFNAETLIGESIDVFHQNPSHQSSMLEALKDTYKTQIQVNDMYFALTANPVFDVNGQRIGSVVEWKDRTLEVKIENSIDRLINAAAHGDLSERVELENLDGFFATLCNGLNNLVEISEGVVNDTARVFSAMSHGDLTETIDKHYEGAFGKLKDDANATVSKLTDVLTQIKEAASTVTTGAEEISQGNADLSQRTENQASSLEETASSMEEMTSAVKSSADNASEVNVIAQETQVKATEGGSVVKSAVDAMGEINESSKKISEIIGVIDEIAFQTNLLALNAAVEAARAGEQGRGFAVVASEVRSLAQRSADAAKEIKDLIRDSVEKVGIGSELVNRSGETLDDIVESVSKVSNMVQGISNSATEQSSGIDQVNKAVSQMDEMTQQNAALVEEATAAGETMAEQARRLSQLVAFFSMNQSN